MLCRWFSEPDRNHRPGRSNFSILGDARLAPVRRAYNVTLASLKPGSINEERDSIYFRFFKEEELCPSCFCFVNLNRFGECVKCAAPARHMREAAPKLRTAISKYNLKCELFMFTASCFCFSAFKNYIHIKSPPFLYARAGSWSGSQRRSTSTWIWTFSCFTRAFALSIPTRANFVT